MKSRKKSFTLLTGMSWQIMSMNIDQEKNTRNTAVEDVD